LTRTPFRAVDAIAAGLLTRRQLRGSSWRLLFPGIYVHAEVQLHHFVWCRAAALMLGSAGDSAVSGWSAAFAWGVDILPRGAPVEVTVPWSRQIRVPGLRVVRSALAAGEVVLRRGVPVTTPVRTAFDLGRRLPLTAGVVAVDALCHQRLTTVAEIRAGAAARRWRGVDRLVRVLALADPRAESPMETRLRLILIAKRLPAPAVQYVVRTAGGNFVARVDLAYPEHRLAIEYDGDHHRGKASFYRDLARQNALRAEGWTVLRFTAADMYGDLDAVAATVRAALRS
jgi:very-short-patch-repair endonuclease